MEINQQTSVGAADLEVAEDKAYKRPLDLTILIAAHLCPLLLPVWVFLWTVIPLLIWLEDRGPIFYRQIRVGKQEREFTVLKFRTMRSEQAQVDGEPTVPESAEDPRVTRVGRVLRRTALDELPQVLGILTGHMSFVGPRPMPPDFHQQFLSISPLALKRVTVRPGLTGLAQVSGGYDLDFPGKLQLDLDYVARMSLALDLKLIGKSVWRTVCGRWAVKADEARASSRISGHSPKEEKI